MSSQSILSVSLNSIANKARLKVVNIANDINIFDNFRLGLEYNIECCDDDLLLIEMQEYQNCDLHSYIKERIDKGAEDYNIKCNLKNKNELSR